MELFFDIETVYLGSTYLFDIETMYLCQDELFEIKLYTYPKLNCLK